MRVLESGFLTILLATSVATSYGQNKPQVFVPPDVVSVRNIVYPISSLAYGLVTLSISLDDKAQVKDVRALRDIPSLTESSLSAVKMWTFSAGKLDGNPVDSHFLVHTVFNPSNLRFENHQASGAQNNAGSGPSQVPEKSSQFVPARLVASPYANYPLNSIASIVSSTVVLDVTVTKNGQVGRIRALRDVPSLTPAAILAVRNWSFRPATFEGTAIASHVAVAFIFRPPSASTP